MKSFDRKRIIDDPKGNLIQPKNDKNKIEKKPIGVQLGVITPVEVSDVVYFFWSYKTFGSQPVQTRIWRLNINYFCEIS